MVQLGIASIKERLFVTETPQKIVFDGYTDPILDAAKMLADLGVKIPGQMDKFAIFYNRNNSEWYTIWTNEWNTSSDLIVAIEFEL